MELACEEHGTASQSRYTGPSLKEAEKSLPYTLILAKLAKAQRKSMFVIVLSSPVDITVLNEHRNQKYTLVNSDITTENHIFLLGKLTINGHVQ